MRNWKVTFTNGETAMVKGADYTKARTAARIMNHSGIQSLVLITDVKTDRKAAIAAWSQSVFNVGAL